MASSPFTSWQIEQEKMETVTDFIFLDSKITADGDCSHEIKRNLWQTWRRQWHPTPVLLPGKSHGRRSLVGCSPWGRWGSDTTERLHFHFSLSCIGEGNGNPLQCSCLENPRDGGAWWAAVYGVTQSWTRLKWLSSSSMTNLDSILNSRDITLLTKVCIVKAMDFPVVMYGCESWTIKKASRRRIEAFELWWWRLLRVPWTARRSNQSLLKEINPEHSLEGLMLKLKLQYWGHLMQTGGKDRHAREDQGQKKEGMERMRWLDSITDSTDMNLSKLWKITEDRGAWYAAIYGTAKSWAQIGDWRAKNLLFHWWNQE